MVDLLAVAAVPLNDLSAMYPFDDETTPYTLFVRNVFGNGIVEFTGVMILVPNDSPAPGDGYVMVL
jgi:hypothetical protein